MNMSNERQNCGSTDLQLKRKIITWEIKGAECLFQEKVLPAWNIKSPSFTSEDGLRHWHLELGEIRPGMLKCHLVAETTGESEEKSDFIGGVVNCVSVFLNDGRLERFSDIRDKHDESNGWKEWAQKFVEKRRKDGITEYIFGRDSDVYDNAVPVAFLEANRDRYLSPEGSLRLNAEVLFTNSFCCGHETAGGADVEALIQKQALRNNQEVLQRLAAIGRLVDGADLVVECGGREFGLHRILVQARMPALLEHILKSSKAEKSKQQLLPSTGLRPTKSDSWTSMNAMGCGEVGLTLNAVLRRTEETLGGSGRREVGVATTGESEMGGASPVNKKQPYILQSVSAEVMDALVEYILTGTLALNLDILTLTKVATTATRFDCGDLTYLCVLRSLELFQEAMDENKVVVGEALKEIFSKCTAETFENREASLSDLKKMHPGAFLMIGSFGC